MLIELPNGKWINPKSVQSIVAGPDSVCVTLSTWNCNGNYQEVLDAAEADEGTAEQLMLIIVADVNAGCAGGCSC
jgi:hypothetical protein